MYHAGRPFNPKAFSPGDVSTRLRSGSTAELRLLPKHGPQALSTSTPTTLRSALLNSMPTNLTVMPGARHLAA